MWAYGDYTWQPLATVSELAALDRYLELHGVLSPLDLPRAGHIDDVNDVNDRE
jgi:hypothetical protein